MSVEHNTDSLQHHGIPGMKWGIRRYQNRDGSLTPAGRRRANKLKDEYTSLTGKRLVRRPTKGSSQKKAIKDMSDTEIAKRIARLNQESKLRGLEAESDNANASVGRTIGRSITYDILAPAAKEAGKAVMTKLFKKIGYQAFGLTEEETEKIVKETSKVVKETKQDADKYTQQVKKAKAEAQAAKSKATTEKLKAEAAKARAEFEKVKAEAAKARAESAKATKEYAEMKKHAETIKRGKEEVNSILKEWSNRQVNLGSASVSNNTKSWVSDRISDNSVGYNTGNATYARGESYISRLRQR